MKKLYEEPKLSTNTFAVEDIITTSPGGVITPGNDGNTGGAGEDD